jgi:AraC-like DNA-binding protein
MLAAGLTLLGWFAAAQGALLSLALLTRREASAADRLLGGLLAVFAAAAAAITASHDARFAPWTPWLELADVVLAVGSGPVLLAWVLARGAAPGAAPRWLGPALLPALLLAAAGGALVASGGALPQWFLVPAIALQATFTAASIGVRRGRPADLPVRVVLGGMLAVHLAQLVRRLGGPALRDVVPAALAFLLFCLALVALRESAALSWRPRRPGPVSEEEARIHAALVRLLSEERLHLDPDLTVAAAARRLGSTPAALSRAVNRVEGRRFAEVIAERRVAEAKALLLDAGLAHLSVEAIGGRAGFGSRSAFFAAFRRLAGVTPSLYRAGSGGPVQGSPRESAPS